MAANLTPQYLEAEAEFKRAQTAEDRLDALRKMLSLVPKHKASEKLQADLKSKIRDAREACEHERTKKKGGVSYRIPRQGAGQVALVGAPNSGKSRLLSRLTRATPEVAPYPFTTREPSAGMMDWEDVRLQLVDLPPITADVMEGYVASMIRSADAALLVVDLSDDDGPFSAEAVLDKLAETKTRLVAEAPADNDDFSIAYVPTLLLANKSDADGADDRLAIVREMFANRFTIHVAAAERGDGLGELRTAIYQFLRVMRVYSKHPGKPPDKSAPFTCPIGSTVHEFAGLVHRDFEEKLKSARVWGAGVFDGQTVKRDHVLHEGDIVELHL
jgi:ribosome-interacting GTPase 1